MMKKVIAVIVTMLLLLLVFGGCGVSQKDFDALTAEWEVAKIRIADLDEEQAALELARGEAQVEIDELGDELATAREDSSQLEAKLASLEVANGLLTTATTIREAWEGTEQRYLTLREDLGFEVEVVASWMELPVEPDWPESSRLYSVQLIDEPPVFEAACVFSRLDDEILATLYEDDLITTMTCRGGTQDYEMTILRNETGEIIRMMMAGGDSWCDLVWAEVDDLESLQVQINGKLISWIWPEDPADFWPLFQQMHDRLVIWGEDGGLVAPEDEPLMFLALGELSKPPRADFIAAEWSGIARRIAIDLFCGIPASCLS